MKSRHQDHIRIQQHHHTKIGNKIECTIHGVLDGRLFNFNHKPHKKKIKSLKSTLLLLGGSIACTQKTIQNQPKVIF